MNVDGERAKTGGNLHSQTDRPCSDTSLKCWEFQQGACFSHFPKRQHANKSRWGRNRNLYMCVRTKWFQKKNSITVFYIKLLHSNGQVAKMQQKSKEIQMSLTLIKVSLCRFSTLMKIFFKSLTCKRVNDTCGPSSSAPGLTEPHVWVACPAPT